MNYCHFDIKFKVNLNYKVKVNAGKKPKYFATLSRGGKICMIQLTVEIIQQTVEIIQQTVEYSTPYKFSGYLILQPNETKVLI